MKQTILFLSLSALLFLQTTQAQKNETIEGNGHLVTRDVSVQPFTALDASGVYELKLTQGASESVKIEADENLQELFTVRNDGSKLVIEMKNLKNKNLRSKNKMRVYVQFKNLNALDLKLVGNVSSSNNLAFDNLDLMNASVGNVNLDFKATSLHLENKSVGNVTLSGQAENAVMKNNGVGSLQAGDFEVQTLDIDNSSVGAAEVNASKDLKVKDSFLGRVKNKGAATARKMNKVSI
ncbi:MAG TPA: head GIN domain-containing protein [Chitinophagaceae bacterium]|nr:head GIN domain-containing protein [Chitinophagaceae bacterium]